jgi:ABC-type transporter Mla subunit MlaD
MKVECIALMFIACLGCQSWHTLRVSFDSADKVKAGDIVVLGNTKIGSVKNVKSRARHRLGTITILLDKSVDIPSSPEFMLEYDAFGTAFISISPSGETETIDRSRVQHGTLGDSPSDTISTESPLRPAEGLRPSKKH